ncbi:uncharacterized protein BJ171DRAFT_497400 [Polychytrium aggregatum]|uniref:uncharacterized protein n=1 Tax=Polychytrium aggregatum TaxID=110093 RepID=UPI0022FF2501|nr:uncharacterized protein BJ171DRAFT_497400 [Polychytrium aggregatum]KAI9206353.1 hypothetical protein BJ171DRAFT_497400 [Polychytrium aggregatum]
MTKRTRDALPPPCPGADPLSPPSSGDRQRLTRSKRLRLKQESGDHAADNIRADDAGNLSAGQANPINVSMTQPGSRTLKDAGSTMLADGIVPPQHRDSPPPSRSETAVREERSLDSLQDKTAGVEDGPLGSPTPLPRSSDSASPDPFQDPGGSDPFEDPSSSSIYGSPVSSAAGSPGSNPIDDPAFSTDLLGLDVSFEALDTLNPDPFGRPRSAEFERAIARPDDLLFQVVEEIISLPIGGPSDASLNEHHHSFTLLEDWKSKLNPHGRPQIESVYASEYMLHLLAYSNNWGGFEPPLSDQIEQAEVDLVSDEQLFIEHLFLDGNEVDVRKHYCTNPGSTPYYDLTTYLVGMNQPAMTTVHNLVIYASRNATEGGWLVLQLVKKLPADELLCRIYGQYMNRRGITGLYQEHELAAEARLPVYLDALDNLVASDLDGPLIPAGASNGAEPGSGDALLAGVETVSLRCPFSMTRMEHPGKSTLCKHKGSFDLLNLLRMSIGDCRWKCPVCRNPITLESLEPCLWTRKLLIIIDSDASTKGLSQVSINPDGSVCLLD